MDRISIMPANVGREEEDAGRRQEKRMGVEGYKLLSKPTGKLRHA